MLIALGYPYITGYKPFAHHQQLLFDVVSQRLGQATELQRLVAADVDADVDSPSVEDILSARVSPPEPPTRRTHVAEPPAPAYGRSQAGTSTVKVDYLKREAANAALGAAGEKFVIDYERARLVYEGRDNLAASIEHISETRGDGAGFDILSFDENGKERLIEVKTTRYGAQTPFYVTRNELRVSEREAERYNLYRVFTFRKDPKLFLVHGAFSEKFDLNPTQYVASVARQQNSDFRMA